MNVTMLFNAYEILKVILGVEFVMLAAVALGGVLHLIRLNHVIRKRYLERVEVLEVFYDALLKERHRISTAKEEEEEEEKAAA